MFLGGHPLDKGTQCPMYGLSFFFSFELSYQRVPLKPPLGGAPDVGDRLPPKPLAVPALIAEWSCVLLSDSLRRRNGPGRNWPVMPTIRELRFPGQHPGVLDRLTPDRFVHARQTCFPQLTALGVD